MHYNIYKPQLDLPYPMPGAQIDVYKSEQKRSVDETEEAKPTPTEKIARRGAFMQSKGQRPEDCPLERDNMCLKEVPSYNDENGCFHVSLGIFNLLWESHANLEPF